MPSEKDAALYGVCFATGAVWLNHVATHCKCGVSVTVNFAAVFFNDFRELWIDC